MCPHRSPRELFLLSSWPKIYPGISHKPQLRMQTCRSTKGWEASIGPEEREGLQRDPQGWRQRVTPTLGAGAWNSTSPFLLEGGRAVRCGVCSGMDLALSQQVQAILGALPWTALGAVPSSSLDLGSLGWVCSLSQMFPGQIQTILPVESPLGCKARGWHRLSSVLKRQGATHLPI